MIGGSNIVTGVANSIFCDTAADLENLTEYAKEKDFAQGSTCLCIETGDVYCMQSDYVWKKI